MVHSHLILGRYAILQHDISAQLAEHRQTQSDKRVFFTRFANTPSPPNSEMVENGVGFFSTEAEKLARLAQGSNDNLFVAKTVFPFVLFADTLKIDRQKVTIVHNDFLLKSRTVSTEIKNIMNIESALGPLFGTITITSKHFLNNTQTIKYLRRGDVVKAQRLLQGFIIAQRAKVDTDHIDQEQLIRLLNDLGQENRR